MASSISSLHGPSSSSSSSYTPTFYAYNSLRKRKLAAAAEEEVEEEEEEEKEGDFSDSDKSSSDSDETFVSKPFLYQNKHGNSLPTLVGVERPAGEMVATGIPPHVKNLVLLEAARVRAREREKKTDQMLKKMTAEILELKQMIRDLSQQGLHPIGIDAMKAMLTDAVSSIGCAHPAAPAEEVPVEPSAPAIAFETPTQMSGEVQTSAWADPTSYGQ